MDRFWSKVDRGESDECWEWRGGTTKDGYGRFHYQGDCNALAHRVAMELEGHDIEGRHVLHHCDNKPCVNPDHLYIGDHADNMADAVESGLIMKGEEHPDARLTDDEVAEVRSRYAAAGVTQTELADEFGVTQSAISDIVNFNVRQ